MLFDAAAHEPLAGELWSEARARAAIERIVAEAETAVRPDGTWPDHPLDEWPSFQPGPTTLYLGAAGMVWALAELGSSLDLIPLAELALDLYRAEPDFGEVVPSLLMGESGLLLVLERLAPDPSRAGRLLELVRANEAHESNELMWGAPGTMLAARFMHERTGDGRWAEEWRAGADRLLRRWEDDGLWTQTLSGKVRRFLGPAHGFAGNVRVLLDGGEDVGARAAEALEATAVREDGVANWPPLAGGEVLDRVQWCHGAPGMVASLWDLPAEDVLLAGGELTWRAGPLAKGPGLCHGTAGNGYAFLKLFRRTGDERWLERARTFAMHAIGQVERAREEYGRGRFSLWTGDVGVALYLKSCLEASAEVPTIDFW